MGLARDRRHLAISYELRFSTAIEALTCAASFDTPARGDAQGDPVGISGWNLYHKQERDGATVWWKLHDPNFNRFQLIHPCDGQTDGFAIAYSVLSMLSRANNEVLNPILYSDCK